MGLHAISACHLLPSTQLCGGGEPPNGSYPKRFLLAELFGSLLPVLLILFPEAAGWMKLLSHPLVLDCDSCTVVVGKGM